MKVALVKISKPYILFVVIMKGIPGFIDFFKKVQKLTRYKIVRLANLKYKIEFGIKVISDAGPLEFIRLIKNAADVITNSFHGMAFSIIFQKPFYTFLYNNHRDIRLKEIKRKFWLEKRLIAN